MAVSGLFSVEEPGDRAVCALYGRASSLARGLC